MLGLNNGLVKSKLTRRWLNCEQLESREVPSRPLPLPVIYVGAETGAPPVVKAYDAETGALKFERTVYESTFTGGVRVGAADFTGDGYPDIVVGAGRSGSPRVQILDGHTGLPIRHPLVNFYAFDKSFTGGVEVVAADFNGDGQADLLVGAGQGGGPHVRVYDGKSGVVIANIMAFDEDFRGGVSIAAGDFTGDGKSEFVVGAGPGGGPHVKVYSVQTGQPISGPLGSFFAFDSEYRGGIHVGSDWKTGDVTGDGVADLTVASGVDHDPVVKLFDGKSGTLDRTLPVFDSTMTAGVRVGMAYVNDDDKADIVVSTGVGVPNQVRVYDGLTNQQLAGGLGLYTPFGPTNINGVTLATTNDPPNQYGYYDVPLHTTFPDTPLAPITVPLNTHSIHVDIVPAVADGEDRLKWSFVVTNLSNDSLATDDMYDLGMTYFEINTHQTSDVTFDESLTSSDWNGSVVITSGEEGYITWTGTDPLLFGESATFVFYTPVVPVVGGTSKAMTYYDDFRDPLTAPLNGQSYINQAVPGYRTYVNIEAVDDTAYETTASGDNEGMFRITRTSIDTNWIATQPLTVNFDTPNVISTDIATRGVDYNLFLVGPNNQITLISGNTLNFAPGQSEVYVMLQAVVDTISEVDELAYVEIEQNSNYDILTNRDFVKITEGDEDVQLEIRDSSGVKVEKLKVAKWENAFEPDGNKLKVKDQFISLDPDRFTLWYKSATKNTDPSVKDTVIVEIQVRKSEASPNILRDHVEEFQLIETGVNTGIFESIAPLILVSVEADDEFKANGVTDNDKNDQTLFVKLGDRLRVFAPGASQDAEIPILYKVKIAAVSLKYPINSLITESDFNTYVGIQNEIFAQVGIIFEATFAAKAVPAGVVLNNGFTYDVLSNEFGALIRAYSTETVRDLEMYFVNNITPPSNALAYAVTQSRHSDPGWHDIAIIGVEGDQKIYHTMAHEIGHLLINSPPNTDDHISAGDSEVGITNFMASPHRDETDSIYASRRIWLAQAQSILTKRKPPLLLKP